MNPPALDISDLVKDYRGLRPLRVRRLRLAAAEQLIVLGFDAPAAEMMTTLITGATLPDAGSIEVLGTSTAAIRDSDEWLRFVDRIGTVTNRAALLDSLTVIQNLSMTFTLEIEPPPPEIRERAGRLAAECGLSPSALDARVDALDDDARTRLHLARAVSLDPGLLLLEHPTARLRREAVRGFANDVSRLSERRSLAVLTLTADDAFAAASRHAVSWDPATGETNAYRRPWRLWS